MKIETRSRGIQTHLSAKLSYSLGGYVLIEGQWTEVPPQSMEDFTTAEKELLVRELESERTEVSASFNSIEQAIQHLRSRTKKT